MADRSICFGVDVGGTFTDGVLTDGDSVWRAKSPTTPDDISSGVLAACRLAAERSGSTLEELMPMVARFGLGTTAVTNVLASRRGRRMGMLTTKGFNGIMSSPRPQGGQGAESSGLHEILNRHDVRGVTERIDRSGAVVVPLDTDEVVAAARDLVENNHVEALVISFLWAFRNPTHEAQAVAAVQGVYPDLPVMSAADLNPIMREYERTTFSLLNAYASGAFRGIHGLDDELRKLGLKVPLLLVHSAGGAITVDEAQRVPIVLAASGPAAGVAAALRVGEEAGSAHAITCDMGGTSFDVAVVEGTILRRTRGAVSGVWTALSVVDVESIGAGGGSIGWADARGMLRVGPQSAGSVPGPACYGRGGTEPTVTDALLVLGFLDPNEFLGGEMTLDLDAAIAACQKLGDRLGMSADDAAWGIRELALEGMVKAVRSIVADRGVDPRTHSVVSYGGSGSLFTAEIARAINSTRVIVPGLAAVLSAFGAATTDVRRERVRSLVIPWPPDLDLLDKVASELRDEVLQDLTNDGVTEADRSITFELDVRFKRQVWELPISAQMPFDASTLEHVDEEFKAEYGRRYGRGAMVLGAPLELVNLRAIGTGRTVHADYSKLQSSQSQAPTSTRSIRVGRDSADREMVRVVSGSTLKPGSSVSGPAIINQSDTTIWVPPRATATVDDRYSIVQEVQP